MCFGDDGRCRAMLHPMLIPEGLQLAERFPGGLFFVVLSIFPRQRGSPESKPVAAAHRQSGGG
jgi:hypothetical protein